MHRRIGVVVVVVVGWQFWAVAAAAVVVKVGMVDEARLTFKMLRNTFNQGTFELFDAGAIGASTRAVSETLSPGPTATSSGSPAFK